MEARALISSLFVFLLAACDSGGPKARESGAYPTGKRLLIAASDYATGRLDVVPLEGDGGVYRGMTIHPNAIVRSPAVGDADVIVNRGSGNLRFVDKKTGAVVREVQVGATSFPQDIAIVGPREAWVTRYASAELLRIDPSDGRTTATLSLKHLAVPGQPTPQMTHLLPVGNQLYVQLQRLVDGVRPADEASIVTLNTGGREFDPQPLVTKTANPVTDFKLGSDGDYYVGFAGVVPHKGAAILDGGVERFHIARGIASRGLVTTEAKLGGDILDIEMLDGNGGVAVVCDQGKTKLVTFDGELLIQSDGFDLSYLATDRATRELYVTDRTANRPMIRIFDTVTLKEKKQIPLTLPPYWLTLAR